MSDDLIERLLANALDECDEAAARIETLEAENAQLRDKIEGLEADLQDAVRVAIKRGAVEWGTLNYPDVVAALSASPPKAEPLDMTRPGDVEYDT